MKLREKVILWTFYFIFLSTFFCFNFCSQRFFVFFFANFLFYLLGTFLDFLNVFFNYFRNLLFVTFFWSFLNTFFRFFKQIISRLRRCQSVRYYLCSIFCIFRRSNGSVNVDLDAYSLYAFGCSL